MLETEEDVLKRRRSMESKTAYNDTSTHYSQIAHPQRHEHKHKHKRTHIRV